MSDRGKLIDRVTQEWVRTTGRKVSFAESPWLSGPIGGPTQIADEWLLQETERLGGTIEEGGGLLDAMSELAGDDFDPNHLASPIVDFYERTSEYRMEVWSQWNRVPWPFGWLIASVFSRRLDQLNIPLRPLDTADGIDSRILLLYDQSGVRLGAAWLRTMRATGQTIYSGCYSTVTLPEAHRPSLRVVFPLPNGAVTVFLRPEARADGTLALKSPVGPFGTDGAYLIVSQSDRASGWVRRVPLSEEFVVSVEEGGLHTDHTLALGKIPVLQLRYRIVRI